MGRKHIGAMTLSFQGYVTSLITWPFDSPYPDGTEPLSVLRQSCLVFTNVTSALEVFKKMLCATLIHVLLTYLLSATVFEIFGSEKVNERTNQVTNQPANKHDRSQYLVAEVLIILLLLIIISDCLLCISLPLVVNKDEYISRYRLVWNANIRDGARTGGSIVCQHVTSKDVVVRHSILSATRLPAIRISIS